MKFSKDVCFFLISIFFIIEISCVMSIKKSHVLKNNNLSNNKIDNDDFANTKKNNNKDDLNLSGVNNIDKIFEKPVKPENEIANSKIFKSIKDSINFFSDSLTLPTSSKDLLENNSQFFDNANYTLPTKSIVENSIRLIDKNFKNPNSSHNSNINNSIIEESSRFFKEIIKTLPTKEDVNMISTNDSSRFFKSTKNIFPIKNSIKESDNTKLNSSCINFYCNIRPKFEKFYNKLILKPDKEIKICDRSNLNKEIIKFIKIIFKLQFIYLSNINYFSNNGLNLKFIFENDFNVNKCLQSVMTNQ